MTRKGWRKYNPEQAIQLRRDGKTNQEIATALGVSKPTICKLFSDVKGVKRGMRPTTKAILDLFALGDKPEVIAHKLNITSARVRITLHREGALIAPPRAGEKSPRRRAARILKDAGLTYEEIGQAFGVSRQRAQQYVRPTETVRAKIVEEHGGKCDNCGASGVKLEQHHTDYKSSPSQLLCTSCHREQHGHIAEYVASQKVTA